MPNKFIVVLSSKEHTPMARPKSVLEPHEFDQVLPNMTRIFRMNFRAVFSSIYVYSTSNNNTVIYGIPATISNIYVCYSDIKKMVNIEHKDYIVAVVFCIDVDDEEFRQARDQWRSENNVDGASYFSDVINEATYDRLLDGFRADVVGFSSHFSTVLVNDDDEQIGLIASYFHYGWIMLLRLERDQIAIRIDPSEHDILYSSADIIQQRVDLINIKRRFLSHDRTNVATLQDYCNDLRQKYKFDDRFLNLSSIHELFEHHLDNVSKIMQLRKTKTLSNVLTLLTFSAIPLGFMGVIFALNLGTSIFTDIEGVLKSSMLYKIVAISSIIPAILLGLAKAIDWMLFRRKKG